VARLERRRQGRLRVIVAGVVLLLGAWLIWSVVSAMSIPGDPDAEHRGRLGRFRPDLTSTDSGVPELQSSASYLRGFKRRLAEAVESEKPVLPRWEAGGVTWLQVKAWRVKTDGLVFDAGSGPDAMAWSEIGTAGMEALARAAGLPKTPEDRLGLAVYYLCAGDAARAKTLLDALRGTPLAEEAARIQAKLGK
jgi:hypothetical protein